MKVHPEDDGAVTSAPQPPLGEASSIPGMVRVDSTVPSEGADSASAEDEQKASIATTTFNLIVAIIGAGVLSVPKTFAWTGLVLGIILYVAFAIFVAGMGMMLVFMADRIKVSAYADIMQHAWGRLGYDITQGIILLQLLTSVAGAFIVIGDFAVSIALSIGATESSIWAERRFWIPVITFLTIYPLTLRKQLKGLRWTSTVSVGCFTFFAACICFYYSRSNGGGSSAAFPAEASLTFFRSLPIILLTYSFQSAALPIYAELQDATPARFLICVGAAIGFCVCLFLVVGIISFLWLGTSVAGNVLASFPTDDVRELNIIVQAAVMFAVMSSAPINLFVTRLSLHRLVWGEKPNTFGHQALLSTILYVVMVGIAVAVKDVAYVFNINGSIAFTMVTIILPGLAYYKLGESAYRTLICIILVIFGLFIMIIGLVATISDI